MITDLLDLLTPQQMFHLLTFHANHRLVVDRASVKRWMLDNGFKAQELMDGTYAEEHARKWSVATFMERKAVK